MLRKHDRDRRGDLLLRLGAVVDVDGRPCLDIPDAFGGGIHRERHLASVLG